MQYHYWTFEYVVLLKSKRKTAEHIRAYKKHNGVHILSILAPRMSMFETKHRETDVNAFSLNMQIPDETNAIFAIGKCNTSADYYFMNILVEYQVHEECRYF
ncbi:Hypothetical predicted protein [Paramuricea clavata]|uniref:Uncharacterized protein n=1 Tax=Paramuricea clavata TaxID=317549 RepID=A0A7D9L413_PARCT|nr:Hypothetical predicted protein [Paramuricea clavata]